MGATIRSQEAMVALSVGDTIPNVTLTTLTAEGLKPVQSGDVLGQGKVVLFAVPGAFTPTCSDHHLPGFVLQADEILAKGVDRIACIAVNDIFVLGAWGNVQGTGDKILMLADGNGEFAAQAGMELDLKGLGLGIRSQRYATILQDGVVQELFLEPNAGVVEVSGSDKVLKAL
ncbi:MAG: peroxiredoxin [Actinobacteria bacterium]|nr:peroxiredoxin [Actinomycetota bacterium]